MRMTRRPINKRITVERLRQVLYYNKKTGLFRWRLRISQKSVVGTVAGTTKRPDGRRVIRVDNWLHVASRLAVLYVTGSWPTHQVDHKNMNKGDDRWSNLRQAIPAQNMGNRTWKSKHGKGVTYDPKRKMFEARIGINYVNIHLGRCASKKEAQALYAKAAKHYHGEFARVR